MSGPWLTIVGIGEDGLDGLSEAARAHVCEAKLVVGGRRHLELAERLIGGEKMAWPSPLADAYPAILAMRGRPVVVLASGDPFCHGVGTRLAALVEATEMQCFPGLSAFALARARLGWPDGDTDEISFCGRPMSRLAPLLQPGAKVLSLSAGAATPAGVAVMLQERGFGATVLHVMEALGGPSERIRTTTATAFDLPDIHPLNLVAIDVAGGPGGPNHTAVERPAGHAVHA